MGHSRAAAALLALAACTELAGIPPGTEILCTTAADCPGKGQACARGRCVDPNAIDATPPDLVGGLAQVSPARVKAGDTLTVTVEANEALAEAPHVTLALDPRVPELGCAGAGLNRWTCSYTVSAAATENGGRGGQVAIDVRLVDLARNEGIHAAVGTVELDFTAPVLAASSVEPVNVPLGGVLQVFFTVSEELAQGVAPVLRTSRPFGATGPTEFAPQRQGATRNYLFTHLVTTWDRPGPVTFTADVRDAVGNPGTGLLVGSATLDNEVPVIEALVVSPARLGKAGTLTVAFTARGVVAVRTTVGTRELSCAPAGDAWTCTRAMTGGEIADGTEEAQPVLVEVADSAGNRDLATSSVVFDFGPPAVASFSVPVAPLPLGGSLQVIVTPTERLGPAPVLVASPFLRTGSGSATRFPLTSQAGTLNYAFAHTIEALDPQGQVAFAVEMADEVGNVAAPAVLGQATIDRDVPRVTGLTPLSSSASSLGTPLRLRPGVTLTATFDATEPAGSLAVAVGGRAMACGAGQAGSPNYTCTRAVAAGDVPAGSEAAQTVLVSFADAAGNATSASTTVVYDFKAPVVTVAAPVYLPAADNPLQSVTSARAGTRARVVATSDEVLASAPVMSPASQPLPFTVAAGSFGGTTATLEATVAAQADGAYTTTFSAVDLAGNVASFAAGPVAVKTSLPVLVIDQAQVTYLRSPWGNGEPEARGAFTIPAGPYFALAPGDTLSTATSIAAGAFRLASGRIGGVRIWADTARSSLLGTLYPNADGSWPRARLQNVDVPSVWATALDEAGNESVARPVEDQVANAEWVATPRPNAVGTNPHTTLRTAHVGEARRQWIDTAAVEPGEVAGSDGSAALAATQLRWEKPDGGSPPGRAGHAVAYDPVRGRLALFGGRTLDYRFSQETWEWDGLNWHDVTPASGNPAPRVEHAMAYDAARGRVVMFGGRFNTSLGGVTYFRDIWEWDGNAWTEVTPAGPSPAGRRSHAMAYDAGRGVVVLFGGSDGSQFWLDTWEWDGRSWAERTPATGPDWIRAQTLVHDASRRRTVLFRSEQKETWEWDGAAWTHLTAADGTPPDGYCGMVHDGSRGQVVMFTTSAPPRAALAWTGTAWAPITGYAFAGPCAPTGYDTARRRAVVISENADTANTWECDGTPCANRTPSAVRPPGRYDHDMAFDRQRGQIIVAAGAGRSDTWLWDGVRWIEAVASGAPVANRGPRLAWDGSASRIVAWVSPRTWAWNGGAWTDVTPVPSPTQGYGSQMTFDGSRVVFWGDHPNETWLWSVGAWTQGPANPTGLSGTGIAASGSGRVILFDGPNRVTWERQGSAWVNVTGTGPLPPARQNHAMAADTTRARPMVFGGATSASQANDTWEWTGTAWRDVTPSGVRPPARRFTAWAYDEARQRMVLFSGLDEYDQNATDTWLLDATSARRPAIQLDVTTLGTGIDRSRIGALRVRGRAGARSTLSGAPVTGANLLGWTQRGPHGETGAWVSLGQNGAGIAASPPLLPLSYAASFDWANLSPDEARSFMTSRDGVLSFQVRPNGTAGVEADGASVALDYLEVRVRYATR